MKTLFTLIIMGISMTILSQTTVKTVQVQLFEWSWTDISLECEKFLGPAGVAAIQVSPPTDHAILENRPWYERYQPVSYELISRSGNDQEFRQMVKRCKKAGVDIYVDAVINHMTWTPAVGEVRKGMSGAQYSFYQYPEYSYRDFHHYTFNGDGSIADYNDRFQVQNGNLALCADLDTASTYVQNTIASYLNKLIDYGVTGFRVDAAKHIPAQDLYSILSKLTTQAYVFQEVIDSGYGPIKANEYFINGDVLNFRYSNTIRDAFVYNQAHNLFETITHVMDIPSEKAVVFVDNHDIEREGLGEPEHHLNYKNDKLYTLANIFMLAYPYGYPRIYSGYKFNNFSQGPPTDEQNKILSVFQFPDKWTLFHRKTQILEMVNFRNHTNSNFYLTNHWTGKEGQIAWGRGHLGHVVINASNTTLKTAIETSMSPGVYEDILHPGEKIVINSDGKMMVSIGGHEASAVLSKR